MRSSGFIAGNLTTNPNQGQTTFSPGGMPGKTWSVPDLGIPLLFPPEAESMDANFWLIQTFNGVSYGALLFLLASGLTLIFGVMRIVNLSHGAYFLLGGYVALTVIKATGSWVLALPVAALTIAALGITMERVFLRPLGFDPLRQV